jgi:Ca2+-binding EF-hand superfamily protein
MNASRGLSVLLVALILASSTASGDDPSRKLPDDVFAQATGDDAVDVLLFGTDRAAIVRVHINVGARSFRDAWGDFAIRLQAFLDRDDNRVLTAAEADRASSINLLTNLNRVQGMQLRRPASFGAKTRGGTVAFNELANYLQVAQDFEPLGTESGAPPDARAVAVFGLLDRDGDKVITRAELAGTDSLFAKLDRDEDEILSLDELTPDRSPLSDRFRGVNVAGSVFDASTSVAIPLTSTEVRSGQVKRLLGKFGKGVSGKLGPEAFRVEPTAFMAADGDGDGLLDAKELMRYLESPRANLELLIALRSTRPGQPRVAGRVEKAPARDNSATTASLLSTRAGGNGSLIVVVGGSEFEFLAIESQTNLAAVERNLENQFKTRDANKDGAIDAQEASGNVILQRTQPMADRNGDGKMTESELRAYIDLSHAAEESRVALTVSDMGIPLHEQIDADRDGRFSVRELRGAASRLASFDTDHDGRFSFSELPRRTMLNLGRGPSQNRNRLVVANPTPAPRLRPNRDRTPLPAWFVGMDRNHDGDVSPREFLGPSAQFRQLDADGDGLIDGDEATGTP